MAFLDRLCRGVDIDLSNAEMASLLQAATEADREQQADLARYLEAVDLFSDDLRRQGMDEVVEWNNKSSGYTSREKRCRTVITFRGREYDGFGPSFKAAGMEAAKTFCEEVKEAASFIK